MLIKNAKLIGFNNEKYKEGLFDIKINQKGKVSNIDKTLDAMVNEKIVDVNGYYVSPGWVDIHTHIYHGVSNIGLIPDVCGPETGVTTLLDAGSAGEANFLGFKKYIIDQTNFPVFSLINLGSIGLTKANQISEIDQMEKIDINSLINCTERFKKYIKGIKIRASGVLFQNQSIELLKLAKNVSEEVELPLFVHIGEPLPLLTDILKVLDRGDVVTHSFHGKRWGILKNSKIFKQVKNAQARGVNFDIGHGQDSFNFIVAQKAMKKGLEPDTISTDLHGKNIDGPVWDLPTTMSKFLNLGMNLEDIIYKVTRNPSIILGLDIYQKNIINKTARLTVFDIKKVELVLYDSNGNKLECNKLIVPKSVILGNDIIDSHNRYLKHLNKA